MIILTCQVVILPQRLQERDFAGTPYVPVYVMLPVSCLYLLYLNNKLNGRRSYQMLLYIIKMFSLTSSLLDE